MLKPSSVARVAALRPAATLQIPYQTHEASYRTICNLSHTYHSRGTAAMETATLMPDHCKEAAPVSTWFLQL